MNIIILLKILNFFKGYVKICIKGKHAERFINICAKKNIYVWNIKRKSKDMLEAYMSEEGYKLTDDIAIDSETEIELLGRLGFPVFIKKIAGRSGLILGFLIASLLFFWMTSRVWYIEIAPSDIPETKLREDLKKAGVDIGVKTSSIDSKKLQAKMMNINPQIEWIWAKKSGTMIFIDVRERVKKPIPIDITEPCNLISTHDGTITFSMITEGRAMVTVGSRVSKGQLLAGGVLDSKVVGARGVHSQGSVKADVLIKKSGDYLLTEDVIRPTGKKYNEYIVSFGKKEIRIPSRAKNFKQKEVKTEVIPLKIGDIYFPISIIKKVNMETINEKVKLNKEEVIKDAEKYLDSLLQKEVGSGTIIERYFFHEDIEKNIVRVKMEALCNIEIAEKQPIEED